MLMIARPSEEARPPVRPIPISQLVRNVEGGAAEGTFDFSSEVVQVQPRRKLAVRAQQFQAYPEDTSIQQVIESILRLKFLPCSWPQEKLLEGFETHPTICFVEIPDCFVGSGAVEMLVWSVCLDQLSHASDLEDTAPLQPTHLGDQSARHQPGAARSRRDSELLE
jgi:hypothetical protein